MKLFLSVVCVMAVIAVNGSDLTDSGLQKEEKNHQPQIFREIISLDQDFDAQSRKAACSDKGGRCIKNKRDCPNNLPLTEFGKTFCRKGRKCCVPDTICNMLCEEDRSGSPPPATVCWGSPDGKDTASFPGPCWAERAAECDPNYANWIYKFDGPCFCQLQIVMGNCDITAISNRYYYNWNERKCVPFQYDDCPTNANNFDTYDDCFNTCAAFIPPKTRCDLVCKEDPSGSPPAVCWGSPDSMRMATFPGPCWAERAAECDPNYANFEFKFHGPCICQLQLVVNLCERMHAVQRFTFNWAERRCVEFSWDTCPSNANNFASYDDCVDTCAQYNPVTTPVNSTTIAAPTTKLPETSLITYVGARKVGDVFKWLNGTEITKGWYLTSPNPSFGGFILDCVTYNTLGGGNGLKNFVCDKENFKPWFACELL